MKTIARITIEHRDDIDPHDILWSLMGERSPFTDVPEGVLERRYAVTSYEVHTADQSAPPSA